MMTLLLNSEIQITLRRAFNKTGAVLVMVTGLLGCTSDNIELSSHNTISTQGCEISPMTAPFTVQQLRETGGRAFWSPTGNELAFMENGQAYIKNIETSKERCLTCAFDTQGFERVQFLGDGSLILIGPRNSAEALIEDNIDIVGRLAGAEIYWMPADASIAPKSLGIQTFEGVAMAPNNNQIAWTWIGNPTSITEPQNAYVLYTATVSVNNKSASLIEQKSVISRFEIFEAQDILDNGETILFTSYYSLQRRFFPVDNPDGEVMTVNVISGEVTNHTSNSAYDEAEGVFHGTDIDVIESGRDTGEGFGGQLDLYLLRLNGKGDSLRRLTFFSDTEGEKANNPDVNPNGRQIAFSKGLLVDDASEATAEDAGLFLLDFQCR
ncbi:MAG: hypothetical protein U1D69_10915 [Polynucleobacter sp.]|nr:hypothetical protein [Polynucleobacter sp.]